MIDTIAQRNNAIGRARRIADREAQRTLARLLAKGGKRYEARVIEGMGMDDKDNPLMAFGACNQCHRPFVQDWAIREMGQMIRAALGKPEQQTLILNMLGTDVATAQQAVEAMREVETMDEVAILEQSRQLLESRGYRVLPPEAAVAVESPVASVNGHGGHGNGLPREST